MLTAALVFVPTYIVVALGRVPGLTLDRTGAAVVGASFMIALGVITPQQAYGFIDLGTIALLFGMMVVVANLRLSGFFRWATVAVVKRVKTGRLLLFGVIVISGVMSALFVNDTVCLALTPLILTLCAELEVRPTPYLMALATASNLGSVATLTGNPQNMLIGVASGLSYRDFFFAQLPVALAGLAIDFLVIAVVYRKDLAAPFKRQADPPLHIHPWLMAKSLAVSVAMIGFFFLGTPISEVALAGAALLLLTRRVKPAKVFGDINWNLLVLFCGLFVLLGAARQSGLVERAFELFHANQAHAPVTFSVVVAALSNLVSNVPAVMLFTPLVPKSPDPHRAWLLLAMASTLAGNFTLLGSIANLIVAEGARHRSALTFAEYLKVGVPVTVLTLAAGVAILS